MNANKLTQRDAFWRRILELARSNRDILVVSEDMGAPALDPFRRDLPAQFVNVGIAEQNGILVAGGLALEGKHPFVYAIAPFVSLRCLEEIRVVCNIMKIPVTLVGVGAGFGYEDSGPTHHLIEDIAVLRAFPHMTIYSPSDSTMAAAFAEESCSLALPNYIRLDRQPLPVLYPAGTDFSAGFSVLREGRGAWIVATGVMTHAALRIAAKLSSRRAQIGVIDLYRIPTAEDRLAARLRGASCVITMEEHFLPGGLGSYVLELLNTAGVSVPVKRLGLPFEKGYCYVYGGRDRIHRYYGVADDQLTAQVSKCLA